MCISDVDQGGPCEILTGLMMMVTMETMMITMMTTTCAELLRGNPGDVINIVMDRRYNSTTIASRKTSSQNALQAIGIACETITEKKYILAAAIQNKLCWTGVWLRGKRQGGRVPRRTSRLNSQHISPSTAIRE